MTPTVTSFTPPLSAPRQRPVDIAPQPEYKSKRDFSLPSPSVLESPTSTSASLEIVDPDSPLLVFSANQECIKGIY